MSLRLSAVPTPHNQGSPPPCTTSPNFILEQGFHGLPLFSLQILTNIKSIILLLCFVFASSDLQFNWTFTQTSYLSQMSQIISVEKNLSCGKIPDFCKEFEQFIEFYQNLCCFCSKFVWRKICVEKISVEKKDKYEVCWSISGKGRKWSDLGLIKK